MIRRKGRRFCAVLMCTTLIASNLAGTVVAADDRVNKFKFSREDLYEEIRKAYHEHNELENKPSFSGENEELYTELFEDCGSIYELNPEVSNDGGSLKLRVFAKLYGDVPLEDDQDEMETETWNYVLDSNDEIIFLLTNATSNTHQAIIYVDGQSSGAIPVVPRSTLIAEDAASASSASISFHSVYRLSAVELATASTASPADADSTDEPIDFDSGVLLDPVLLGNRKTAVAFILTVGELGLDQMNPPETVEIPESDKNLFEADMDNVLVQVFADPNVLPKDAELRVTELKEDDDTAEQFQQAKDALDENETDYDGMMALDISFYDTDENEIEPDGEVQVMLTVAADVFPEDIDPESVAVQHLAETEDKIAVTNVADTADQTDGTVEVNESSATAEFVVESFSTFTVTWKSGAGNYTTAYAEITIHRVDENGNEIGTNLSSISITSAGTYTISDYAYGIDGYNYNEARLSSYAGDVITDWIIKETTASGQGGPSITTRTITFMNETTEVASGTSNNNGGNGRPDNNTATLTYVVYLIYNLSNPGQVQITYDTNLPYTPSDEEYDNPWIEGGDTYEVTINILDEGSSSAHTVLALSQDSYFYDTGKYLGKAVFAGWSVDGSTTLFQPGDSLDLTQYSGKTVNLKAKWNTTTAGSSSSMVNFFVALKALPEGTTEWTGSTATSDFTSSVYLADVGVTGDTALNQAAYAAKVSDEYYVLGGTSGTDLNENHTTITGSLTSGYTKNDCTYQIEFPTDEEVLRTIRAGSTSIKINNNVVSGDELTTENFTIKWYVFKYASDGWHMDGILVAKTGKLVVSKTFAGDPDTIASIMEKFTIYVKAEAGQSEGVNTSATLNLEDADMNADTNTYTWTVDVDQYYKYKITESNYKANEALKTSTAQYMVKHSNTDSENTSGWQTYDDGSGITVTGRGYNENDSERLTVSLLNTYTRPGTWIIQKIDAATGNRMSNVSFTISKQNDEQFQMYDSGDAHYTADSRESDKAADTITTDYSGQAYLWIGGGTYILSEAVPTGYDDPGEITVVLEGTSENQYKVISINKVSATGKTDAVEKGDTLELIIKNTSRTVDLKIKKIWEDGENTPVTIQLYRNGAKLGSEYARNMDGTEGWTYTFENMPLYADGGAAAYTIREEAVGDFKYSEEYSDGYRYYDVTYQGMTYYDEGGNQTTDMSAVKTIELSVANKRTTSELFITKADSIGNSLPGAEFYLYTVPEKDLTKDTIPSYVVTQNDDGNVLADRDGQTIEPLKKAVSTENGTVSFGNMQSGDYYLIEHAAPAGYINTSDLYRLSLTDSKETLMYRWDSDSGIWQVCGSNQVVNRLYVIDTGILLDSLPYAILLGMAAAGAAVCFIRRRKEDDSDLD
jgi:hypothetical protein